MGEEIRDEDIRKETPVNWVAMISHGILVWVIFSFITGILYPGVVTLIAYTFFETKAKGSLLYQDQQLLGSLLIGQSFREARYFWGRPSATEPFPYNPSHSMGANLGPSNPILLIKMQHQINLLKGNNMSMSKSDPIPIDLITSSGSGLDPHISTNAAFYQIQRVASERGMDPEVLKSLVKQHIERKQFGILGEVRVNVLKLNIALDQLSKMQKFAPISKTPVSIGE